MATTLAEFNAAPRCPSCHHRRGDHDATGRCRRWLTVATSTTTPPEQVQCPYCTGWNLDG